MYPGVLELAWCCVYCVLYCIVPVIIAICEFGQIGRVPAPPRPAPTPPRAGHPANGAVPVVPVPCPVWEPGPPLIIFTYTAGLPEDSRQQAKYHL